MKKIIYADFDKEMEHIKSIEGEDLKVINTNFQGGETECALLKEFTTDTK